MLTVEVEGRSGVSRARLLYQSANGDRWLLVREDREGRVAVRHEPNAASGGAPSDRDVGEFLAQGGHGPQHGELLRLIGTLLEDDGEVALERPAAASDDPPAPRQGGAPMEIRRAGSAPSARGQAGWFTGAVRLDPLFGPDGGSRAAGVAVTFEPGARTAWHTHPLGQTLIVTAGCGRAQCEGGPVEELRPGDVVRFAPGEKHWHGAAASTAMTHIAIHEEQDGRTVDWLEPVSDEEYARPPG